MKKPALCNYLYISQSKYSNSDAPRSQFQDCKLCSLLSRILKIHPMTMKTPHWLAGNGPMIGRGNSFDRTSSKSPLSLLSLLPRSHIAFIVVACGPMGLGSDSGWMGLEGNFVHFSLNNPHSIMKQVSSTDLMHAIA